MLIQCPECKQQISDQAEACPKCGRPVSPEERRKAVAAAKTSQKAGAGCCIGCLGLIVILYLIGAFGGHDSGGNGTGAGGTSGASSPGDKKIEAWVMAQHFVKDQLKAPGTADFGSLLGDYQDPNQCVVDLGSGRYAVSGWVDAQNSFGAKIRSRFSCTMVDLGNEQWRCEGLAIAGH